MMAPLATHGYPRAEESAAVSKQQLGIPNTNGGSTQRAHSHGKALLWRIRAAVDDRVACWTNTQIDLPQREKGL